MRLRAEALNTAWKHGALLVRVADSDIDEEEQADCCSFTI
jgi:hypothetical protein